MIQCSEVEKTLLKLGFKVDSLGFRYWKQALYYYRKNYYKNSFTLGRMYELIAKDFNTTWIRVERAMRTASKSAKENISLVFSYNNKITTKVILELLVKEIIYE